MSAAPFQFRDSYFPALEGRRTVTAGVEALNRDGRRLRERGEISAAIAKHQEALRLKSNAAATHQNLALAWWRRGNLPEALAAYRRVMELRPGSPGAHSDYLYALYHDSSCGPGDLLRESVRWAAKFESRGLRIEGRDQAAAQPSTLNLPPSTLNHQPSTLSPRRRLRVGYVSADFRRHTLRHFISPLLKAHDRSVVEVFCYSNVGEPDRVTELLRPLADQWREVRKLKDDELAELIRRDRIDILVDLSGHMGGNRLPMFARKPAPVQVQIYFAGTSGLPQMDDRITDGYSDPVAQADRNVRPPAFCTEQLVRLAGCAWPYEPEENTPAVGSLPAASKGHITFGSMNRPIKISEKMIGLWCRILHAVPNSKLLFLADAVPSDVEFHYQRFARHGIGADRLIPLARAPRRTYLEAFNGIDFCLDTFPYAGDTTTCDGLWMGVPTLTLAGDCFHARRGVSHLSNVGLAEWIAGSEEEYVQKAIGFAKDVPALSRLRGELRDRMRGSALMDFVGYARRLEEAHLLMWERRCGLRESMPSGLNPHPCPPPEYRGREEEAVLRDFPAGAFPGATASPGRTPTPALPRSTGRGRNANDGAVAGAELEALRRFFVDNPPFQAPAGCGVVTASDGNLFFGLQMLLMSIGGRAPVAVFDLGLSEEEVAWCKSLENVAVMKPPMLPIPKAVEMWQGWNKPFYLKASPFESSIWIDADAFVVGDLSPLFAAARERFWVIKHQLRYPRPNDLRLYQMRPVRQRFPAGFHHNSGVVGFGKDDPIIDTWAAAALEFASDPKLRDFVSYYDEGALHWAIESIGCHGKVINRPQWNRMYFDLGRRYPSAEMFVSDFDRRDSVIVHATGPKLWTRWPGTASTAAIA